jgi:hypothetical protein
MMLNLADRMIMAIGELEPGAVCHPQDHGPAKEFARLAACRGGCIRKTTWIAGATFGRAGTTNFDLCCTKTYVTSAPKVKEGTGLACILASDERDVPPLWDFLSEVLALDASVPDVREGYALAVNSRNRTWQVI